MSDFERFPTNKEESEKVIKRNQEKLENVQKHADKTGEQLETANAKMKKLLADVK